MMKSHGKEYEYSVLKVFLPDVTFKQLSTLTKFHEMPNNAHTLVAMINMYYNEVHNKLKAIEEQAVAKIEASSERLQRTEEQTRTSGPESSS